MTEIVLGVAVAGVGVLLVVRGALLLRAMMAVWAALAGFLLGAGVVAAWTGDRFLSSVLAVGVGLVVGVVLGAVAYLYYAVAMTLAMAGFGFTLGTDLLAAAGVRWSWLVVLGGVVLGVALASLAVIANLPMVVLVVLSALSGGSLIVTGLMLVLGTLTASDLTDPTATQDVEGRWWLIYAVIVLLGLVAQLRSLDRWRASVHEQWGSARGGRSVSAGSTGSAASPRGGGAGR